MEIIPPSKTIEYFDNIIDQNKAKNLHSICIARSIHFLVENVPGHNDHYRCQCFKCRVCRLLVNELLSRKYFSFLKYINKSTFIIVKNGDLIKFV